MTSFTDLLANNKEEEEEEQNLNQEKSFLGWGMNSELANYQHKNIDIPKYKSFPPAYMPMSPSPLSPSSYLLLSPSLTPSAFLDSPVLFPSSNVSLCVLFSCP